jgi:hypothetical protein
MDGDSIGFWVVEAASGSSCFVVDEGALVISPVPVGFGVSEGTSVIFPVPSTNFVKDVVEEGSLDTMTSLLVSVGTLGLTFSLVICVSDAGTVGLRSGLPDGRPMETSGDPKDSDTAGGSDTTGTAVGAAEPETETEGEGFSAVGIGSTVGATVASAEFEDATGAAEGPTSTGADGLPEIPGGIPIETETSGIGIIAVTGAVISSRIDVAGGIMAEIPGRFVISGGMEMRRVFDGVGRAEDPSVAETEKETDDSVAEDQLELVELIVDKAGGRIGRIDPTIEVTGRATSSRIEVAGFTTWSTTGLRLVTTGSPSSKPPSNGFSVCVGVGEAVGVGEGIQGISTPIFPVTPTTGFSSFEVPVSAVEKSLVLDSDSDFDMLPVKVSNTELVFELSSIYSIVEDEVGTPSVSVTVGSPKIGKFKDNAKEGVGSSTPSPRERLELDMKSELSVDELSTAELSADPDELCAVNAGGGVGFGLGASVIGMVEDTKDTKLGFGAMMVSEVREGIVSVSVSEGT